ncbi:MoxR family ATPase [Brevibacterium sp. BDJS002]|uniref:ATPase n=1 Tax=Brevibacterium aurantiacum TaxID=273384 RepID=A0A2A3YUC5_BREAU|nr:MULTISPECIES: MoxR family ATPase [Brevibacterium]MDN5585145.1 MoxR family ATPase [Brevibacterium sp.]AZL10915.1 MoxR family ATPase [Brevibacterium aurantiacum]PCC42829.1 ATPase [Brevibacterium aurantiacum]PCC45655.1 ATPase [Brevibacterium aurantiacum]WCE40007.1 MoxR family ATPase [Brevibacterium sp. BDJS002]
MPDFTGALDLANALGDAGYMADESLATASFLAGALDKPLLCEGAPGVGKTSLAKALAEVHGTELIRLQCHEGLDSTHALYDWDFAKQILHVRTIEAAAKASAERLDATRLDDELHSLPFLLSRPILQAIESSRNDGIAAQPRRPVLLIDEIDRAGDEFDALLLEVLSDWSVTVPELGTIHTPTPPLVILTSNRTRELHDALKRRCVYHWFSQPDAQTEERILAHHVPDSSQALRSAVVRAANRLRAQTLVKPPGTSETIDWIRALDALGISELDEAAVRSTISAVLKDADDLTCLNPNSLVDQI